MPVSSSPTPSSPSSRPPRPSRSSRKSPSRVSLAVGAGAVAAALLLGYASYTATKPDSSGSSSAAEVSADPETDPYAELAKLARRDASDPLAMGRVDAPVVMIEYADFKCGYCGKFARDTEPALVKKYVDEGTLRIEWRNFPIFGAESEAAARAAWAAGRQGRFWQFHAAAYAQGAKEEGFGEDRLKALAEQAGVPDLERFTRDADGEAARAAVKRDQEEAYGLGATSTPSFLVNGRPIAGAQPTRTFTEAIEAAKAQAASEAREEAGPEAEKKPGTEKKTGPGTDKKPEGEKKTGPEADKKPESDKNTGPETAQ
ncbi:DsbA family protein [Streptomyces sp. NPDC051907]|uniref:DsbA family protein n=1 Tax=Streptomyces sp. NPDC051907 TaxID=3155284 RepID=UPI003449072F